MGFGYSEKPNPHRYTIHEQADICEAVVEDRKLDSFHVFAHDYGDTVAQELLARQNEGKGAGRWLSLCLLNGGLFPETHQARLVQKLLLSPVGPLVTKLSNKRVFERSLSEVFGRNTQPSREHLDSFWTLINENDGKRVFHNLITYMSDRKQHRERWVRALQESVVPIALGQTVIRAKRASGNIDRLWDVSIFQFDPGDGLYRRINARTAVLEHRAWRLNGVHLWDLGAIPAPSEEPKAQTLAEQVDEMSIGTDLTVEHIQDSFAAPQTISFWDLPGFIGLLEESGFASNRHRMHWHGLLASPVVFIAMVLIGAAFSMRHARFGGMGIMALGCVMAGFGFFILSDIATALGASGTVPVIVAAWAPPISAILFALGLLLHLEDG